MLKRIIAAVMVLVMAISLFAVSTSAETAVVYGDVNKDGNINSTDALNTLQAATGLMTLTTYQEALADVNADGKINSSDALSILQFATGLLTKFNKDYANTLKAKNVDPIIASGKYTLDSVMEEESVGEMNIILSTDGKDKVFATKVDFTLLAVEVRYLYLDGENYQVVPPVSLAGESMDGSWCYTDQDVSYLFDGYMLPFTSEMIYHSTTQEKISYKTYDCETFCDSSGNEFKYYFYNGSLTQLVMNGEQTCEINSLKAGAKTDLLTIPSDYVYDPELGNTEAA